ncbi:hypothetical protein KCU93_g1205, partial [Aureobasidium melanogenum]
MRPLRTTRSGLTATDAPAHDPLSHGAVVLYNDQQAPDDITSPEHSGPVTPQRGVGPAVWVPRPAQPRVKLYIGPHKQHDDGINELLYAVQSWNSVPRTRQQEALAGQRILALAQHPLLGQSPSARCALLYDWAKNDDPGLTSMTGIISSRLHIYCGVPEDGVGFPALTDIGTGPAESSHYQIVWRPDPDSAAEELAIPRILHALHKEMAELARNPGLMADIELCVYNWLTGSGVSGTRDRLQRAKDRVCLMIGEFFKDMGYDNAMRMYS